MSKYLVTTALEDTWPEESGEVIFLGEWCKLYQRKEKWSEFKSSVQPYHWDDREKLFRDYKYLESLQESLLRELAAKLNQLHNVDHSIRYWRILIGYWLGWFVQTLYDRWFMLKATCEAHSELSCLITKRNLCDAIPNDTSDYCYQACFDDWNEVLYSELIKKYFLNYLHVSEVERISENKILKSKIKSKFIIKKILKKCLNIFKRFTGRKDEYFFINNYLSPSQDFKLQLKLGQIPKIWEKEAVNEFTLDLKLRNSLLLDINDENDDDEFKRICLSFIPHQIPKVFLEGFQLLKKNVNAVRWPENPKVIFTSNSIFADDFFKMWSAEKTEEDTKLIIGQHGGNLGMSKFEFYGDYQIEVSNKWLSWGWINDNKQNIIPVGNLKTIRDKSTFDAQGEGLLITMQVPRYSYHLYSSPISAGQWNSYFQDQVKFLQGLPLNIRQSFRVRPDKGQDYGYSFERRLSQCFEGIAFDLDPIMRNSVLKKRLSVSTYNATTFLETLSWNVPTICFWNPRHWELNDSAQPYFSLLKKAGIFHEEPDSAAQQVSEVWDDVGTWWQSGVVQSARFEFCNQYSRQIKNVDEIASHLM